MIFKLPVIQILLNALSIVYVCFLLVSQVFYMDYGFSVETSRDTLLQLHRDFLSLPFQATNVSLAGAYIMGDRTKCQNMHFRSLAVCHNFEFI